MWGSTVRGSWRPNRTAIYWPQLLWPSVLCLSRSPELLNWRPRGSTFCWVLATSLWSPTHQGPKVSLCQVFSPTSCLLTRLISNSWLFVLTELYNSSTPTQSPTQSLEWHVWSSSSGNNCHAVHRSLSSGASVYECTMGILACPILLSNFHPRDFLS